MDPDLENVIRQALGDALAAGKDHLSQTELAVRAVTARHDRLRRPGSRQFGAARMTSDLDIYRSAQALIKQHGQDAPIHAAMRADAMLDTLPLPLPAQHE